LLCMNLMRCPSLVKGRPPPFGDCSGISVSQCGTKRGPLRQGSECSQTLHMKEKKKKKKREREREGEEREREREGERERERERERGRKDSLWGEKGEVWIDGLMDGRKEVEL
jgi:hypothetical protein